jgi:Txe/YoeB family toxin of Txe-Axe toxin-antitoxin module
MNDLIFSPEAFKEYLEWLTEDKKTFKKITLKSSFSYGISYDA